jgi:hypothetical protein
MAKIKLSTPNPDFPLIRQTPGSKGIWGDCTFYINQDIEECDYWIIYDALSGTETTKCPKDNVVLFTGEPPTVKKYSKSFIRQFNTIITCHRDIKHENIIYRQQALPWMAGAKYLKNENKWDSKVFKSYNDFLRTDNRKKDKEISIVISNKAYTNGHEQRIKFLSRLTDTFGDRIHLFGRGFNEIEDKYDCMASYKYSIVLENCSVNDYWTEKLSDAYLCGSFPIYYGCPNILNYFPEGSIARIDIYNVEDSIDKIKSIIDSDKYEHSLDLLEKSKDLVLNKFNLFPSISMLIDELEKRNSNSDKQDLIKIYPERRYRKLFRKIAGSFLPKR